MDSLLVNLGMVGGSTSHNWQRHLGRCCHGCHGSDSHRCEARVFGMSNGYSLGVTGFKPASHANNGWMVVRCRSLSGNVVYKEGLEWHWCMIGRSWSPNSMLHYKCAHVTHRSTASHNNVTQYVNCCQLCSAHPQLNIWLKWCINMQRVELEPRKPEDARHKSNLNSRDYYGYYGWSQTQWPVPTARAKNHQRWQKLDL